VNSLITAKKMSRLRSINSGKQNLVSVDIARAIAALGVFYYHLHIGFLFAHYFGFQKFNLTDNFGATYAVPLFFLISGYCIHLSNLKYLKNNKPLPLKEYYKRRLIRIYPPYFIAVLFSIIVNFITGYLPKPTTNDLLIHLFLFQGFTVNYFNTINIVLWTITIELAFYLIYPLFYFIRQKFSLSHSLLFTFIVSVISIKYFSVDDNITLPQRYFVLNLWFAWCCGAYIADIKAFNKPGLNHPIYKLFYAIVVLAFIGIRFFYPSHLTIISYQLNILIWTAPFCILLGLENWFTKNRSPFLNILIAIGLSSYSLYLLHEPLIYLKNFLVHTYLPKKLQPAGIIIGVFVIPVITWLSYLYFEKPFILKRREQLINE
jgi:peptidoglycan/LPS O-acetylase OafA/YrhL